jgi:2-methylcitrate dehydratase PrpD
MHAALDALEEALDELQPAPEAIERIDVATYRFASAMQNPHPPNTFGARYSMPHAAAAIVVHGHAGYRAFTEEVLHDPVIVALRQRVHITEDPALSAMVPRLKPARVTVTLKDGRQSVRMCESAKGDFAKPFAESEIRAKFRELAGVLLTPVGVEAIEEALDRSDTWTSVRELLEVVWAHGLHA